MPGAGAAERTILIVDDEPDVTEVLADVVHGAGYRSVRVHHGRAALAALAEGGIDLMLIDLMMPGMSGDDVLAELDRRATLRRTAIVVMSAGQGQEVAERYGLPYLKKPSSIRVVLAIIESALAAQRVRRADA
jgi:CheY-like chemotaxis protein